MAQELQRACSAGDVSSELWRAGCDRAKPVKAKRFREGPAYETVHDFTRVLSPNSSSRYSAWAGLFALPKRMRVKLQEWGAGQVAQWQAVASCQSARVSVAGERNERAANRGRALLECGDPGVIGLLHKEAAVSRAVERDGLAVL